MLDDINIINQRDPDGALGVAAKQFSQANFQPEILNPENDGREIVNIVIAGMGGSALAALLLKTWLSTDLNIPIEVVRNYDLPKFVTKNSLVIASSYSGNTEETLSCWRQALERGCQVAVVAAGGRLVEFAKDKNAAYTLLPGGIEPRMALIYNLRALVTILVNFKIVQTDRLDEIASQTDFLKSETEKWLPNVPTASNYAKQLAEKVVGKSAEIIGGSLTASIAYKWKISWNENAKNVAFWNELPEFNHNEFIGWTSHPIEKPYTIIDLISKFENPRILKRFEISDRLLSGKRPKSINVELQGETVIGQMLWGCILADFVSIYLAILNGVNPTPVALVEKLKQELQ